MPYSKSWMPQHRSGKGASNLRYRMLWTFQNHSKFSRALLQNRNVLKSNVCEPGVSRSAYPQLSFMLFRPAPVHLSSSIGIICQLFKVPKLEL